MASTNVISHIDRKKPHKARKLGVQRGERQRSPVLRRPNRSTGTRSPFLG